MSKEGDWYATYEDLPLKLQNQIRPSMFPPPRDVAETRHLDRWWVTNSTDRVAECNGCLEVESHNDYVCGHVKFI